MIIVYNMAGEELWLQELELEQGFKWLKCVKVLNLNSIFVFFCCIKIVKWIGLEKNQIDYWVVYSWIFSGICCVKLNGIGV